MGFSLLNRVTQLKTNIVLHKRLENNSDSMKMSTFQSIQFNFPTIVHSKLVYRCIVDRFSCDCFTFNGARYSMWHPLNTAASVVGSIS